MTAFVLLAVVLALAAGLAVAWPLLRRRALRGMPAREANLVVFRDQLRELDRALARGEISPESHARALAEVRERAAEDIAEVAPAPALRPAWRWAGAIAGAGVLATGAIAYVLRGNPDALDAAPATARPEAAHARGGEPLAGMAERLAQRLRANPEDGEGWAMLARSLAASGKFREAAEAFGEAGRRLPAGAALLADHADALAMSRGRRFDGEPDRLIEAALTADPQHVKALAIAGTSAYARGDHAVAARHWRRALSLVPAQGDMARQLEASAREAERRSQAGTSSALTGTVSFASGQSRAIDPAEVLFVIARAGDGPGRPVAVARLKPPALPAPFRLDDGHSLVAAAPLSAFSELRLEARLARDGTPAPRPGDPKSPPRLVRPGERAIALELRAAEAGEMSSRPGAIGIDSASPGRTRRIER